MVSRYDMMKASDQTDLVTNLVYPDPLSVDYGSFQLTTAPYVVGTDDRFRKYPFLIMYAIYGQAQYDDIILSLNNIPHLSKIQDVDTIPIPSQSDLLAFIGQRTT